MLDLDQRRGVSEALHSLLHWEQGSRDAKRTFRRARKEGAMKHLKSAAMIAAALAMPTVGSSRLRSCRIGRLRDGALVKPLNFDVVPLG